MDIAEASDRLARLWKRLEATDERRLKFWLRVHLLTLGLFVFLFFFLAPFNTESAVYFWLPFAWGLVAAVHFFVVATLTVDEEWTEERTLDLKIRSYDLGHMEDIRDRHEDSHPSAVNRAELDRIEREKKASDDQSE